MRRFAALAAALAAAALFAGPPEPVETVLDRVAARLESFNPKASWTGTIESTQVEHDRQWRPKETLVLTKTVTVTEGRREEEILKAVELADGKPRDVTEEYLAERRARIAKYQARQAAFERENPGGQRPSRRSLRLESFAELLPFSVERRTEFVFGLREAPGPDGRRLYLLDVRTKLKDVTNWEGTYTIDAATFTPVSARLRPSDTPAFVKDLEVEAEFEVVEDVNFVPRRTWVKVNAGFLFLVRHRVILEDVYSDVRITR